MLKKQISKEQIRKCLDSMYLVAFALFLALAFMYTTTFEIEWPEYLYYNVRLFLAIVVFARIVYSEAYNLQEGILAIIICFLFLAAWRRNSEEIMLNALLLILGSKGISFKKMIKVYFGVTAGLLLFTMAAALSGKIENLVYFQNGRVNVRSPRKSIFKSPSCSSVVIVNWVVTEPSAALDNGTYSSTDF